MSSSLRQDDPTYEASNLESLSLSISLPADAPPKVLAHVGLPRAAADAPRNKAYPLFHVGVSYFSEEDLQAEWDNLTAARRLQEIFQDEFLHAREARRPSRVVVHAAQASQVLAGQFFSLAMLAAGCTRQWTIHAYASATSVQATASWTQEALLSQGGTLAHFLRQMDSSDGSVAYLVVEIDEATLSGHPVLLPWLAYDRKRGKSTGKRFSQREKPKTDDIGTVQAANAPLCAVDVMCDLTEQAHLFPRAAETWGLRLTLASLAHALKRIPRPSTGSSLGAAVFKLFRPIGQEIKQVVKGLDLSLPQQPDQIDAVNDMAIEANDAKWNMLPLNPTLHRMLDKTKWYVCPFQLRPVWIASSLVPRAIMETWTERPGPLSRYRNPDFRLKSATLINAMFVVFNATGSTALKKTYCARALKVVSSRCAFITRTGKKRAGMAEPSGSGGTQTLNLLPRADERQGVDDGDTEGPGLDSGDDSTASEQDEPLDGHEQSGQGKRDDDDRSPGGGGGSGQGGGEGGRGHRIGSSRGATEGSSGHRDGKTDAASAADAGRSAGGTDSTQGGGSREVERTERQSAQGGTDAQPRASGSSYAPHQAAMIGRLASPGWEKEPTAFEDIIGATYSEQNTVSGQHMPTLASDPGMRFTLPAAADAASGTATAHEWSNEQSPAKQPLQDSCPSPEMQRAAMLESFLNSEEESGPALSQISKSLPSDLPSEMHLRHAREAGLLDVGKELWASSSDSAVLAAGTKRKTSDAFESDVHDSDVHTECARRFIDWWVQNGEESDAGSIGDPTTRRAKVELDALLDEDVPDAPVESDAQFKWLRSWARSADKRLRRAFDQHCLNRASSPSRIKAILGVPDADNEDYAFDLVDAEGEPLYDYTDALEEIDGVLNAAVYHDLCVSLNRTAFFLVLPLMLTNEASELDAQ